MQEIITLVFAPLILIRLIVLSGIYLDRKMTIVLLPIAVFFIYINSALMLERNIYMLDSGYGTDIIHYLAAFQELITSEINSYQELLDIALSNTSSAEPFFWFASYLLSILFNEPEQIWLSLTFISLVIYSISLAKINPTFVLVGLILYISTITFFVFSGSAIRQFLALSLLSISIAYYKDNRKFILLLFLTLMTHGTMIFVVPLVFLAKIISKKEFSYKTVVLYGAIISLTISLMLIYGGPILIKIVGGGGFIVDKLNSKLVTENESFSWFIQFLIEAALFSIFCFFAKDRVPKFLSICFILLTLSVLALAFIPGFGDRIYRCLYIIYILNFAYYFNSLETNLKKYYFATMLFFISNLWYVYIYIERYQQLFFNGNPYHFITFNPLLNI